MSAMHPLELDRAGVAASQPPPASPSREPNLCGRARAMTVFSPVRPVLSRVRPGGALWLSLVFTAGRLFPGRTSTIRDLSFIHFARWMVIRRVPDVGQPHERLRHPLLLFESNYNGTFDQYIDAFSQILTKGMTAIWGTSYGFPGPRPVAPFKRYIRANEFVARPLLLGVSEGHCTRLTAASGGDDGRRAPVRMRVLVGGRRR